MLLCIWQKLALFYFETEMPLAFKSVAAKINCFFTKFKFSNCGITLRSGFLTFCIYLIVLVYTGTAIDYNANKSSEHPN